MREVYTKSTATLTYYSQQFTRKNNLQKTHPTQATDT